MNGIEPLKVLAIFVAFTFISFAAKALVIPSIGTLALNIFSSDTASIYISVSSAILLSGLVVGKIINLSVNFNPLTHSLIVGGLAGVFKALRPEINPLPFFMVGIFAALNFVAIPWGTHVTSKK